MDITFQISGYLAIVFSILGFISHNRKYMLIFGIISTILFGVGIYSYGGYNGLFVSMISVVVKLLSLYLKKKYLKYVQYSAPFFSILAFFILPEGLEGIIPSLTLFFIILADTQKDLIKMKQIYYGSNLLWLSYGIILMSPSAILFDTFGFFAITYGIWTLKKEQNLIKNKKL